jgi:general secretion pathway protein D
MNISQEVSEPGDDKTVGGVQYPSFRERKVDTTLSVAHGQTLVIGGLMRERGQKGISGVPFLSKIPGIGFLFGADSEEYTKTELILLITPRVIVNSEDVDLITEDFKRKIDHIRQKNKQMTEPLSYLTPAILPTTACL